MKHKARVLSEKEVMENRSSKYDFIEFDGNCLTKPNSAIITPERIKEFQSIDKIIDTNGYKDI